MPRSVAALAFLFVFLVQSPAPLGADLPAEARRLIGVLELGAGDSVADLGAGSGELSVEVARQLGRDSRVYATEINDDRLREIREAVSASGLTNITVVKGTTSATGLPDGCCGAIFLRSVYHHFADPPTMNAAIARALEPAGRLAVMDFEPRGGGDPAPPARRAADGSHGVTARVVARELEEAGFEHQRTLTDWGGLFLVLARKPAPRAGSLAVTFIANAAVKITDGGTTLLSDFPYQSGYSGYMEYDRDSVAPAGATLSLITHRHPDHFDASVRRGDNWRVMGPADVRAQVPAAATLATGSEVAVGPMRIRAIKTPHADLEHYSYMVEWMGRRFYFTGDTNDIGALLEAADIDVAFVTPWLFSRTRKEGRPIPARRTVIYHHEEQVRSVPGCAAPQCVVPRRGERIPLP